MQYKYETEQKDFSDLASGRVFYSLPGHPAFPVRLASEIFQRCLAQREKLYRDPTPCTLYDPCCGAAYHLSVLTVLHRARVREVIASDVDETAVALARRNLSLLLAEGMDVRIRELSQMYEQYGKESHREALQSAEALKSKLSVQPLGTNVFQASAFDRGEIAGHIEPRSVDIVFTDVPYGLHSQWESADQGEPSNPLESLLEALLGVLSPSAVVAVASDKGQK